MTRRINQGTYKLARTPTLIKKKYFAAPYILVNHANTLQLISKNM
jgi:hypothetical protein